MARITGKKKPAFAGFFVLRSWRPPQNGKDNGENYTDNKKYPSDICCGARYTRKPKYCGNKANN